MAGNRFGKIEATVVSSGILSNLDWVTLKNYTVGDIAYSGSDGLIRCISTHTSGTYSTDKTTKWKVIDGLPLGAVIPIYNNALTGSYTAPNTGAVDSFRGLMRADGAVIPGGNQISGTTPNLSDSRFLMGSTTSGTSGGQNSITLIANNLPTHTHDMAHTHGSFTSGTESVGHSHSGTSGNSNQSLNHDHEMYTCANANTGGPGIRIDYNADVTGAWSYPQGITGGPRDLTAHTHSFTTGDRSAAHTHSTTISAYAGSTGNNSTTTAAIENRPIYLSVIYLIKVN